MVQTESEDRGVPKYLQLERKEVRLRLDQLRLTENTLIRVAIDLLLESTPQLQGITEDELLESIGLPPSDQR